VVDAQRRRDVGLFRYSLVRGPGDPGLSGGERGRLVRALAEMEHVGPDGQLVRVSRVTLDRWIRAWRGGGFDALVPAARQGVPRTSAALLELAVALKREAPARTAAQVAAIIRETHGSGPSERTIRRHFARLALHTAGAGAGVVFGRFEARRPGDLWIGDAMHGPVVGGRRAILFAFLDDHSRALVGYRFGHGEDVLRLEAALRAGLAARGVPAGLYVDNGSPFVSKQLLRACATLGIRLIHSKPGRPQGRGKIERVFRTVREQFVVEADTRPIAGLGELNRLFGAWVETACHRRVHSETKAAPIARLLAAGSPALPGPERLREAFLWAETRTVTKTATVSLFGNSYEVTAALAGRRVELIFDPADLERIEVRHDSRPVGNAVPVRIERHTHPRARPEPDGEPPPATGIDYLGLIETRRREELSDRIEFRSLPGDDEHDDDRDEQETDGEH
jgi:putative transposase